MSTPITVAAHNQRLTGRVTLAERVSNSYRSEDKLQKKKIRRGKTNWQSRNTR
jgi:hypothetical protein